MRVDVFGNTTVIPFLTRFVCFQWHHWNYLKYFGEVKLEKGIQIITLSTRETGQMNYSYIDFTPVKENKTRAGQLTRLRFHSMVAAAHY
jgi:hypothetical protein